MQARARVDAGSTRILHVAAGGQLGQPKAQSRNGVPRGGQLLVCHALEIDLAQRLVRGKGQMRVEFDALRRGFSRSGVALRCQRLDEPRRKLLLAAGGRDAPAHFRQVANARGVARVAPEHAKRLVVEIELVAVAEKDGSKRPVDIVAPLDAGDLQRVERIEHAIRADRQPRAA